MAASSDNVGVSDKPSTPTTSASQKVVLRKQVSLLDCVALCAGTIIGSGIFISPKGVLANTGSLGMSLIVWVASGFLSIMGALSYAELGTTFAKSGGDFVFLLDGLSPLLAFLRLWTSIVSIRTGGWTVLSITFAKYALAPFFYGCDDALFLAERLLAIPAVIPIVFSCFALFVVVMSLYSAPVECGIGLAITAAVIPVYLVGVKWQTKPVWFVGMSGLEFSRVEHHHHGNTAWALKMSSWMQDGDLLLQCLLRKQIVPHDEVQFFQGQLRVEEENLVGRHFQGWGIITMATSSWAL
ncbi:Y+L amino acid transporter 2-like [Diadema setosum]|uniref:Y+L amino acid transporter 2-like n=1 Tax=Diadema setosum TaxID=31175 RepID=UPI003B3BD74C